MEHRFRQLLAALAIAVTPALAAAQQQQPVEIRGQVLTEAGEPLSNASVIIVGTRRGALTSADGNYRIEYPEGKPGQTVRVTARLIGYMPKTVVLTLAATPVEHTFTLEAAPVQLTGVIVTAEGQVKKQSELGTAAQAVSTEQLNATHAENFEQQLEGKVSGVQIESPGTQGGSVKIVIRGSNSITGNNSPLYVIDGVPVAAHDNGAMADGTGNAGWDYGSSISDLNPDDIASITVLKGPNAAALYGSEAANGAIVITTKHGEASEGKIRTHLNVSYSADQVGILPQFQNHYGQGAGGQFQFVDGAGGGIQDFNDQSFGPRLNGQPIDQFTGPQQPWVAHPNNVKDFFQTGGTTNATLSVSGGTQHANGRMSVGVQNVAGIIPNNYLHKWTSSLAGSMKIGNKITTSANLSFMRNDGMNRPGVGYNSGILEGLYVWFGRQVDMNALKANWNKMVTYPDIPGQQFRYNWNQSYHSNPYWLQYGNPQRDTRNQYFASAQATYQATDWLSATVRAGGNIAQFTNQQDVASQNVSWAGFGIADLSYPGAFNLYNYNLSNYGTSLLINADKNVMDKLELTGLLGFEKAQYNYASTQQQTAGIVEAGIYNVSNAAIPPTLNQYNERYQTNSIFGSASFTWDNWWTVEGTARNDWSSTLPVKNNSYFYPSVNTSIVLTNALPSIKSDVLTYLKLRGSVARVGAAGQPYQLQTTYNGYSTKFAGAPLYTLSNTLANADLKPEITTSSEVGMDVGLWGDRVSLDATYYSKSTRNQIYNVSVSPASGFASKAINAGEITNKGVEALLNITPVRTSGGFEWNTTFSFAKNSSKVVSLNPGIQTIVLGSSWYLNVEARKGDPYGALYGYTVLKDSATGLPLLHNGLPQLGPQKVLGNYQPDWTGGWNNEFKYKHVSLSFLFDIHKGGSIFSVTNFFGTYTGVLASTMRGRQVDWNNPGIVVKGIDDQTGQPNTTTVTSELYFQSFFPIHQPFVYNDTYYKLRELRIGWDLPDRFASQLHVSSASIALYGRNLWTWTKVPNIDPEFTQTTGNLQGVEFATIPNPKSFGFNVQVTP